MQTTEASSEVLSSLRIACRFLLGGDGLSEEGVGSRG
jgi:hypothetical protein